MTTLQLLNYYASLLIFQYLGKSKAYATIQAVVNGVIMPQVSTQILVFSAVPTSGSFQLSYNGNPTASIAYNALTSTIQSDLQAVSGLSSVIVSGSISSLTLTVTFIGVTPPALSLEVNSNSLAASNNLVFISVSETDLTLPLAIQNAFNVIGDQMAQGVQLDVLGKYAGVNRTGVGVFGQVITLDDSDFVRLIQMATATNSSGSSLAQIVSFLNSFFPGQIYVFDYTDMRMSYLINSSVGTSNLIQLFITERLLPQPMAVAIAVIYAPAINFFAFRTYENPAQPNTEPFNDYSSYQTDWPWLTYADSIPIVVFI